IVSRGKKWFRLTPSKATRAQATFLEAVAAAARTQISATEFLFQNLVAMNDANSPFDDGFRREALSPFAHGLEKTIDRRSSVVAFCTSACKDMNARIDTIAEALVRYCHRPSLLVGAGSQNQCRNGALAG